jgi:hypothetical protein
LGACCGAPFALAAGKFARDSAIFRPECQKIIHIYVGKSVDNLRAMIFF